MLFDKVDPALLYVFDAGEEPSPGEEERLGKFVVRVNYRERSKLINSVRTGGMVPTITLRDKKRYELVDGEL